MIDLPTKATIATIRAAGFDVQVNTANGCHVVEAVDKRSGETSVAGKADRLVALVTAMSWLSGTFRLAKVGITKRYIERPMIEKNPRLSQLWDDVTSDKPPNLIRKVHRARDLYVAHWEDPKVANAFVSTIANGAYAEAFLETDSEGRFLDTRYPWGQAAFVFDLLDDPDDLEAAQALIKSIVELLGPTANLISGLLASLLKTSGLELEHLDAPREESQDEARTKRG